MGSADGDAMIVADWELVDREIGAGDPATLTTDSSAAWIPAIVPGGVHEALVAAGSIPDPRAGDAIEGVAWIEKREWWYRARFTTTDAGPAQLVAEGLDTVADLWIDGRHLGSHRNQFRPATFDSTGLDAGDHVLLVRLSPPLPDVEGTEEPGWQGAAGLAAGLRKASFSWGWDFAPRLPSIGIAGPVRMEGPPAPGLTDVRAVVTRLAADRSRADVELRAEATAVGDVCLTLTAPSGAQYQAMASLSDGIGRATVTVDAPELWWTHDLGEPALHTLRAELPDGAALEERVGLRTLELDRPTAPDGGRLFRFVLNGVALFARGSNWVPPSPLVCSPDADLRRDRVLRAREGGQTMLRVWGGGIYEREAFYDACDELGILVWQDFMFACMPYPGDDPDFLAEVEAEARHQISRLRGRACLALWCGNNEVEALELIAQAGGAPEREWGRTIFHDLLPALVDELDGVTVYWPGSPWGEQLNGFQDGDRHDWEVWHGRSGAPFFHGDGAFDTPGDARHWRRYADDTGRFISEFGILAAPDAATFERWMPGSTLHDRLFDLHLTDRPNTKVEELLAATTGLPADLDEYIALTQAAQAEAMLFAFEHFRRRQPLTGGALAWQFNDCWPAVSWSLADVDGVPKAAYYAVKRASAPLAVSLSPTGPDGVQLWLVNNTLVPRSVEVDVELGVFDGGEQSSLRVAGTAAPGESVVIWTGSIPHDGRHYAWASSPTGQFPPARRHFADLGELVLGAGRVESSIVDEGLEIISHGYSYGVRISHPEPRMRLNDNHFDLRDGERRRIQVTGADPSMLTVTTTVPRARAGSERNA